ncbi:hypothetical protein CC1G_06234 [Coprinopsis cinerea okayama7|uniref:Deacetylase sirtuin-type domain-containing protein n=1 Tax=Coprinopsis cinerea (strain Okayama-7 / 130 / ATCC MYA-4618 / FGSC 9003) TaxID=240176 RepID=A8NVB6_COPC7|nr:hypothetical protein CC1G_06234 [Coprinopsis cinerea okayama7\|eukprot:XP_001836647.2 hypothetical protein CC1G_06234 [Coprinopsis cinerea okayama7\
MSNSNPATTTDPATTTMIDPATTTSFREALAKSTQLAILAGAGLSTGSGIPTFTGQLGGVPFTYSLDEKFATAQAFKEDPVRVWRFHHSIRKRCLNASPNAAHKALGALHADPSLRSKLLRKLEEPTSSPLFITQNVDNLSLDVLSSLKSSEEGGGGGQGKINKEQYQESKNRLIEMHGNIFRQECLQCRHVSTSSDTNLAFEDDSLDKTNSSSEADVNNAQVRVITEDDLPRCGGPPNQKDVDSSTTTNRYYGHCKGKLRPAVTWYGEIPQGLGDIGRYLNSTDMLIIVGASPLAHPAAGFIRTVKERGGKVAVFHLEPSDADKDADWVFLGRCEEVLPRVLGLDS